MVTVPHVKGLSEAFSRILKTYRICTAVRPHSTLRNLLVHSKDRISDEEKSEVVYKYLYLQQVQTKKLKKVI